jgi:hypothetical protein
MAVAILTTSFLVSGYLSTVPCYIAGLCKKDRLIKNLFHLGGLALGSLGYIKLCEQVPLWPLDKETKGCQLIPTWMPLNRHGTLNQMLTCFREYSIESYRLGRDLYNYVNEDVHKVPRPYKA